MDRPNNGEPGGGIHSIIQRMFLSLKDQVVGSLINRGEAKDDAEDICQDAFLRFWKAVERGGEKRMTEAYFWAIVQTQKIRHFQKEQIQPQFFLDEEFRSEIPDAEEVLANKETFEILLAGVSDPGKVEAVQRSSFQAED